MAASTSARLAAPFVGTTGALGADGAFASALLCISALRTLLRPGIRVRRGRRRSGNAHGHNRARWNILTAVEIHALFLPARSQTVAANLYTGWRNNHQPPARINRRNLYRRGVSRIRQLVGIPH